MSTQYLKSVDLVFENVESYNVPVTMVKQLTLYDLSVDFDFQNTLDSEIMEQSRTINAKDLLLELDPNELVKIKADDYQEGDPDAPDLLWRILEYADLTGIELYYLNGESKYICNYWGDYLDEMNSAMHCVATPGNNLCIEISPGFDDDPLGDSENENDIDIFYSKYRNDMKELYKKLTGESVDED